jgi:hypothetical protein
VLSLGFDDLRTRDLRLQRRDILWSRRVLEKENDEVLRIQLRFFAKRVLPDDALPFIDCADMEIGLESETLYGLHFQIALELGAESRPAFEHEIAALKHRPDVLEAKLREKVAEVGHANLTVSSDIDPSQQGDMRGRNRRAR